MEKRKHTVCSPKIHSQKLAAVGVCKERASHTHTHAEWKIHKYQRARLVCVFLEFSLRILFSHLPQQRIPHTQSHTNGDRLRQHLPIFSHESSATMCVHERVYEYVVFCLVHCCRECAVLCVRVDDVFSWYYIILV